jgi:Protein of unknown function (DUF2911)
MRFLLFWVLLLGQLVIPAVAFAQDTSDMSGFTYCTFDDGNQLSLRYNQAPWNKKDEPESGKIWAPGGEEMNLFTQTTLLIENTPIAPGAYAVYFIPGKDNWTMVVNKNVTKGAPYNQQDDLVRARMSLEKLPYVQKTLSIYFGHIAPKQCVMRVDYDKVRASVNVNEQ